MRKPNNQTQLSTAVGEAGIGQSGQATAVEWKRDPFEGVKTEDPDALREAVERMTIEEWLRNPPPPPPKNKAKARRLREEGQRDYKARMLARGVDLDDLPGVVARQKAEYEAFLKKMRATQETG